MGFVLGVITAAFYVSGLVLAFVALWRARTPQGATAWVVALIGFPFLAVPFFLVFGRNKFYGYVKERRSLDKEALRELKEALSAFEAQIDLPGVQGELSKLAASARQPGFTAGNQVKLLIDAEETYESMLQAIESAAKYILVQFYIFRDDATGEKFKELLIRKAQQGVRVYFLYDYIGTKLKKEFISDLVAHGIEVAGFRGTKKLFKTSFQINFRNHRKILIIDGQVSFTGGLNIGDDYLGKWKSMGPWRDTHVRIEGTATLSAQISFQRDWYWAKGRVIDLDWEPKEGGSPALVLSTGPADELEYCLLTHLSLVQSAQKRLWIANPYFVPPEGLANALSLAAQRGVDVRIMVPSYSDNKIVMFASQPHMEKLLSAGVKFWKYMPGFLHQKVMLVDDQIGVVGSVNLDSRSFFINFEILAASSDSNFLKRLEEMMKEDFENSEAVTSETLEDIPLWRQIAGRTCNLLAPMI